MRHTGPTDPGRYAPRTGAAGVLRGVLRGGVGTSLDHRPARPTVLAAVGCAVVSVGILLVGGAGAEPAAGLPRAGGPAWWATVAGLLLQSLALCWTRARPRAALLAVALLAVAVAVCGGRDATSLTTLAVVVAVYVAGTTRPLRALAPTVAAVAVLVTLAGTVAAADGGLAVWQALGVAALQAGVTLGLVLLVTGWVAALRESTRAREDERRALVREHEALVQAALDRERTAMARELHDIAAHHLSGIAIAAAALERQVGTDPDGARAAARAVRQQSRSVLRDLRSLVGLLRDRDAAGGARPETLAGIADLVADVVATGRDVTWTVHGEAGAAEQQVGPLAQLAAYRVVQEALANAGRHAPGAACSVVLDADGPEVVLVVRNGPAREEPGVDGSSAGGFGLLGMRERAELTGARVDAGPTDDGGWEVRLVLPREDEVT
ncbi:sensor histidine kinase [Nocardioides abyssi]|uniref:histidine kinase n=1 Tax=Nocardioides abyssi TaxID=3058370 RepID=A0ABT8EYK6_9ACTN|nr:histidine kinase [Nocardioides abyssi]MDN4163232.1 histidine kinase [Nocardioides abyssi]